MIKQLQIRFIRIAVVSLTVAMVLVVGIVNVANWISVRGELFSTLHLLTENEDQGAEAAAQGGTEESAAASPTRPPRPADGSQNSRSAGPPSRHFRNMLAESNWFTCRVSAEGKTEMLFLERSGNLDGDSAGQLVQRALADGRPEGIVQDYLFRVKPLKDGGKAVLMLNCETRIATVRKLVLISAIACAGGILLALLLVRIASRKAVEPVIRNMEQQKQFITNASHELKTPLTVIATNMELLQMETEDSPWVRSTQKQTAALRRLVDELVYLSRMEEEHPTLEMESLDPGKLLEETAEPFAAMAEYGGLEMRVTAEEGLRMTGDRASIQRLMSTLCDNAVKYASGSPVTAEVRGEGKGHILLRVSNPVEEPLTKQQCGQLFNRFYRADPSRNKQKQGGFGIGLAIAAAIAEKHGGRISAAMEKDRLVFTCILPREGKA